VLASYFRFLLFLELVGYAVAGVWLRMALGWSIPAVAAAAVACAVGWRLLAVCATAAVALTVGRGGAPQAPLGAAGVARLIAAEWRAVLLNNFCLVPWERSCLRPDPPPAPGGGVPVILVHGYFANRGYFAFLVRALEEAGAGPVFAPNFTSAFATIERLTDELHAEIERIAAGTREPRVILVCHSMGGLAARFYLCRHGDARVAKLVTIATPHAGTLLARFAAGLNARQMRRDSAFVRELCAREAQRRPACGVTSIYSPHDNLVVPQETGRLAWARNVALPGHGHVGILLSRGLADAVLEELAEARSALAAYSSATTSAA
jgi:predicted alpha/beta hydrolase family esterase